MTEIVQVRLSGFGGQGIVLAGLLLGQAGAVDRKYVAGSSSYGAQARGSDCKSEVIISSGPIDFPHVTVPDILMVMSQSAYDQYHGDVKAESGLILYDEGPVKPREVLALRQVGVPATETALKKLKNGQVANIVLTCSLIEITKVVSQEAIREAIRSHVSERFREINLKAMQIGTELGRKAHG
jgi:2-oxoglutarate ferredoxin oxidoreductase subunit gamma